MQTTFVARAVRFIAVAALVLVAAALFAVGVHALQLVPAAVPEPGSANFPLAGMMFCAVGALFSIAFDQVFNR